MLPTRSSTLTARTEYPEASIDAGMHAQGSLLADVQSCSTEWLQASDGGSIPAKLPAKNHVSLYLNDIKYRQKNSMLIPNSHNQGGYSSLRRSPFY